MKLIEIELDLPYQVNEAVIGTLMENGLVEYEDALKMDYERNWKEKRRKFQLMTRCMTSMIERIMKPITTKDCWKIIIECVTNQMEQNYKNLLGVYTIQVKIDLETFWLLDDYRKKKMVIDIIYKGIQELSKDVSFELNNIMNACIEITNNDYINEWTWKKIKVSTGVVEVQIRHEVNNVDICMAFLDKNKNVLGNKKVISTIPDEWVYGQYLGQLETLSFRKTQI